MRRPNYYTVFLLSVTAAAGYRQYEVSIVRNPVFDVYNLGYWHGDDYVGVGEGAVGYLHCGGKDS